MNVDFPFLLTALLPGTPLVDFPNALVTACHSNDSTFDFYHTRNKAMVELKDLLVFSDTQNARRATADSVTAGCGTRSEAMTSQQCPPKPECTVEKAKSRSGGDASHSLLSVTLEK